MLIRGVEFKRVNDVQKVCKEACCCRGITQNNEKRAGKCAVKCKMEMSGVYSRFVCCWLLCCAVLDKFSFFCVIFSDFSMVNLLA